MRAAINISGFPPVAAAVRASRRTAASFSLVLSSGLIAPCWLQISSARGDLAQVPSSDTPIVMMEPTEYGDCVNAAAPLERPWNRLLVPEAWCGRASL